MSFQTFVVLILTGFSATYLWRFLGVVLSDRLDPDLPLIYWVELVGYALIAAIMSRVIFMPTGELAVTPLWLRITAFAVAILLARFSRLANLPAIACGTGLFVAGLYLTG